jgi:hypothetical protein
MKNHYTKSLFFSVACFLFSIYGTQVQARELLNYPLDTINGVEVYRYHIDRGIGIYRIGVNFNVSQEVLYRYNPQLRTEGAKYNQLIFIPTGRPVVENKAQNVTAKPQQPSTTPQKVEPKPVVTETPVVVESTPQKVEQKTVITETPVIVESTPQKVEQKTVITETPVIVESKPKKQPVVAAAQPEPTVKKQKIEAGRTIIIGPKNKSSNSDQNISTLYFGSNKKDNSRSAEIDIIRIEPKKK